MNANSDMSFYTLIAGASLPVQLVMLILVRIVISVQVRLLVTMMAQISIEQLLKIMYLLAPIIHWLLRSKSVLVLQLALVLQLEWLLFYALLFSLLF